MGNNAFLRTVQFGVILVSLFFATATTYASEAAGEIPPEQVVQKVTDEMMAIIRKGDKALKQNPDQYFQDLETVLEQSVHFDFIAKYVMGDYWSGASDAQRSAFSDKFKRSMVETIGKGLANYSDLKLTINPDDVLRKNNFAYVKQQVSGGKQPITISYLMARTKQGEWKLIDVVLDGVKLRDTFRSQFAAEMNKNGSDYDKVIANWNATDSK